jgi:hypothetical protein
LPKAPTAPAWPVKAGNADKEIPIVVRIFLTTISSGGIYLAAADNKPRRAGDMPAPALGDRSPVRRFPSNIGPFPARSSAPHDGATAGYHAGCVA